MSFSIDCITHRVGFAALAYISLAMVQPAIADSLRIIELNDGSRIAGEILAYESGVYTIQSDTLGQLHIPDESIRAIRSDRSKPAPAGGALVAVPRASTGTQFAEIQSRILNDPNLLAIVMSLQNDPQLLSILNDPVLMRAIAAGDLESLLSSPKILELEDHQTIQQLLQRMGTP
ncbi:MAG: hypothetical protein WBM71_00945 [Sedimenticolaceae bacterium]